MCEIPELLTGPSVENRTKSAAVPRSGACAKIIFGIYIITIDSNEKRNLFFMF
ncbi:MAG: hypothetical protein JXL97_18515 [Bacteroidales bacterium]|nr:hypothetical protein [Bacteroidales bacterium]